eukprot:SAG31_NODE_14868_length_783_cov_0.878655_2_plen_41_part_01
MTPLIEAAAKACKKTVVVMVSPGAVLTPWRCGVTCFCFGCL